MAISELDQIKQGVRASWAAGDYTAVARRQLWPVGERIIRHVGVRPGEDVLDVACGSGNAAIRAAQAGGRVVGVDLTPELFEAGRRLAAQAGVEVEWVEGDAEALPVKDASFDVVVSVFGCMFAPRHQLAADELARALRSGGRLCVCAWTPEGSLGEFFRTIGTHLPPPPDFAQSPLLWGSEEHVRALFAGSAIELEVRPRAHRVPAHGLTRGRAPVHDHEVRPADHGASRARATRALAGAARGPEAPPRQPAARRVPGDDREETMTTVRSDGGVR